MSGRIFKIPAAALADAIMRELEETARLDARHDDSDAAATASDEISLAGLDLTDACRWLRARLAEGPRRADELVDLWAAADGSSPISRDLAATILHAAADAIKVEWRASGPAGLRIEWRLGTGLAEDARAGARVAPAAPADLAPACSCPNCTRNRMAEYFRAAESEGVSLTPRLRAAWAEAAGRAGDPLTVN